MNIVLNLYSLNQWQIEEYDTKYPNDILQRHVAECKMSSRAGQVTIQEYRELLTIDGPLASIIALKHPDWIANNFSG